MIKNYNKSRAAIRSISIPMELDLQLIEHQKKSGKTMNGFLKHIIESYLWEESLLKDEKYFPTPQNIKTN